MLPLKNPYSLLFLCSEQEILRDEIRSLQSMRARLRSRTDELELEVKNLREEMENARKASKSEEEVCQI